MSNYFCERMHRPLLEYWELKDGRFLVREEDGKLCTYPEDQFAYAFVRVTSRPIDYDTGGRIADKLVEENRKRDITQDPTKTSGGVKIVDPSKL